jgi:hypothetical protein
MATSSPAIRSGPLAVLAIAFAIVSPAGARDASSHHFSVYGSLTPTATATARNGSTLQMQSRLSQQTVVQQAGGNFVMNAKAAAQPLGCAGDTIFADGFDP